MLTSLRRMVFVYSRPVDMRKSYDGLYGLVRELDPLSGNVFLFVSRDLKRAKALFWDGSGLNVWMKRMEQGRFANIWLRDRLTASELKIFFEGSKVVVREISPEDRSHKYLPRPEN
jgi:transposase